MKTDPALRVSETEREAGKRANFHVYYRTKAGNLRFDPSWRETRQEAEADMLKLVRGATIVRTVSLAPDVPVT